MTPALPSLHQAVAAKPIPKRGLGFLRRHWFPLLLAALCNVPAIARVQYLPALLSVAAIAVVVLQAVKARQAFWTGIAYIAASGLLLDYWIVPVLTEYTGGNWLVAFAAYLCSWVVLAPFFGIQFLLFHWLRLPRSAAFSTIRNAALFAAIWVVFEWLRAWLFSAVPFMGYAWGSALAQNALLLQPAAYGGVYALSFLLVFPAVLLAQAAVQRNWRLLLLPAACIVLQLAGGWLLFAAAEKKAAARPGFKVALVQPGLSTDLIWDPQNGNQLVQRLLALNRQANAVRPQLIAWTETTVPWTYRADDDFLKALTLASAGTAAHTLLGMTADGTSEDSLRSNSLYLLSPTGTLLGRYDKQELLAGVERPFFGGIVLPFQSGAGTRFRVGNGHPVASPWGPAGLLLCNEATVPAQAGARAAAGATWLAVLGNDAWFADTYIPIGHFAQCRIRAVENRKDLLVNINLGEAGVIRASGKIAARFGGDEPAVQEASIQPNSDAPFSKTTFTVFILVALAIGNRFFSKRKSKTQNTRT